MVQRCSSGAVVALEEPGQIYDADAEYCRSAASDVIRSEKELEAVGLQTCVQNRPNLGGLRRIQQLAMVIDARCHMVLALICRKAEFHCRNNLERQSLDIHRNNAQTFPVEITC